MSKWPHDLKLSRAREHLEELEAKIDRWMHVDGYTIRVKPDPQPPRYLITADLLRAPDDDNSISLLIGDVLQNARSALEYVAFALAEVGARAQGRWLTPWEVEHSAFPIVGDVDRDGFAGHGPDVFRGQTAEKLAAVTPEARAAIEQLQPFYVGPGWDHHPLWILNELARVDRHRFLHLAAIRSGNLRLDQARIRNVKLERIEPFTGTWDAELEDSAEVGWVTAHRRNPQEKMHMHFRDALDVAFSTPDDVPTADGEPVRDTLFGCVNFVMVVLSNLGSHLEQPQASSDVPF